MDTTVLATYRPCLSSARGLRVHGNLHISVQLDQLYKTVCRGSMPSLLCRFSVVLALWSALLGDRQLCMCLTVVRAPRALVTAPARHPNASCISSEFHLTLLSCMGRIRSQSA